MDWKEEKANIRCKCRNLWGLDLFRSKKVCKRCKTQVKARGELNERERRRMASRLDKKV